MNRYTKNAPGVWVPHEKFASVSHGDLAEIAVESKTEVRGRSRLCVHPKETDRMQEMFIAFCGASYIRPSWHADRDESIHFIRGRGKYVFFDADGKYQCDVRLGTYDSDLPFYLRVPANRIHSLIPLSADIVAHEVAEGPFNRSVTHFPAWGPADADAQSVARFTEEWAYAPVSALDPVKMTRISEEAFQCADRLVYIRRSDIERLKAEVPLTRRKRIRILIHPNTDHTLHEMLVVYTKATYVKPNLHIGKDESLHIVEGEADFVFFDDRGDVIKVVQLSATDRTKDFFIRVPQGVFHTIVMRSAMLVIHEATPGPFLLADTVWAPWAPSDANSQACESFASDLDRAIERGFTL